MINKIRVILLATTVLTFGFTCQTLASVIASGDDCAADDGSSSCHWEIDSDGKLTITGSGAMKENFGNRTIAENPVYGNATTAASWGDYYSQITSVEIGEGITRTGDRSFQGLSNVTSVTIPTSLETLGRFSFDRMINMRDFNIPEGSNLATFDSYQFQFSDSLSNESVQSILNTIVSNGATSIPDHAFITYGDKKNQIDTITIPDSVTSVGTAAFQGFGLSTVVLPDSLTSIEVDAFGSDDANDPIDSINIVCKGSDESCENLRSLLADFCVNGNNDGSCSRRLNLADSVVLANESQCNSTAYYWDGVECIREPNPENRVCDHEESGYVKVGDYCASPESSYAKKHYTPVEANQWLKDEGNDIIITFKK